MFGDREGIPSHIDRVVGHGKLTENDDFIRDSARQSIALIADIVRTEVNPKKGILEKGEREKVLFEVAARHVSSFVSQYGGNTREYLFEDFYKIARKSTEANGSFHPWTGDVFVEEGSDIELIGTLVHELLHRGSFHSIEIQEEEDALGKKGAVHVRRGGLAITSRKREGSVDGVYFDDFDEAIVAMCNQRIMRDIANDPLMKSAFRSSEEVKSLLRARMTAQSYSPEYIQSVVDDIVFIDGADEILARFKEAGSLRVLDTLLDEARVNGKVQTYERWLERHYLQNCIDEIFEKGNGRFGSKEDVFDLFARAHFSGSLLPLARVVDGVLGKGAFRRMAEMSGSGSLRKDWPEYGVGLAVGS